MHPDAVPASTEPSGGGDASATAGAAEAVGARAKVPPPRSAPEQAGAAEVEPTTDEVEPTTDEVEPTTGAVEPDAAAGGLTGRERDILAFEQQWWRYAGAKEQAIRDRFDLSATRYYQLLNGLLDNPAALAAEPLLVGRLRRLRSSRARNRRR